MNACRSLSRLDRVWQLANTHVISKRGGYLQGCYPHNFLRYIRNQGVVKGTQSSMGWKKKGKMVNAVWRPLGTESSSNRECLEDDVVVESEIEVSVEDGEDINNQLPAGRVVTELTSFSTTVHENPDASNGDGVSDDPTYASFGLQDNDELKHAKEVLVDIKPTHDLPNSIGEGDVETQLTLSTEKHSLSLEIGASLMRFIRGKSGSTQKVIEEEMGVKIIFPSSKREDSIVIEGNSVESITRASNKIQLIIDEAVKSPNLEYSHFISLPLAIHPELVEKLLRFQYSILGYGECKEDVNEKTDDDSGEDASEDEDKFQQSEKALAVELKVEDDSTCVKVDITSIPLTSYPPKASKSISDLGIDKSIFIKPKTFHLTVLMLKLWNKERVHAAAEVLQSVSSKVIDALDGRPVFVRLKGLDCMRGSLPKAQVLYAPVEEIGNEDRLLCACQVIIDAYVEAGLVLEKDARQKLKLHATVMNARHRKRTKRTRKVDSFDARGIFKQYGSEVWGDYHIREAHLSQRFVHDENGYYHCCASIPFPGITSG
ncbi:hypothetical protein Ancab_012230 [Ancistrocladus abbreviatus]